MAGSAKGRESKRRIPSQTISSAPRSVWWNHQPSWEGVSTSVHPRGEPVAVASSGLSLSHSG